VVGIPSLHARRLDHSKHFPRNICQPDSWLACLYHLLPQPRDPAVRSRLRKPIVLHRTKPLHRLTVFEIFSCNVSNIQALKLTYVLLQFYCCTSTFLTFEYVSQPCCSVLFYFCLFFFFIICYVHCVLFDYINCILLCTCVMCKCEIKSS